MSMTVPAGQSCATSHESFKHMFSQHVRRATAKKSAARDNPATYYSPMSATRRVDLTHAFKELAASTTCSCADIDTTGTTDTHNKWTDGIHRDDHPGNETALARTSLPPACALHGRATARSSATSVCTVDHRGPPSERVALGGTRPFASAFAAGAASTPWAASAALGCCCAAELWQDLSCRNESAAAAFPADFALSQGGSGAL